MAGRLNALLGGQAYPNKVRGVWGKVVAEERYIALTIVTVTARCAHLDNDPLRRASNQLVIGSHKDAMAQRDQSGVRTQLDLVSVRLPHGRSYQSGGRFRLACALTRLADKICLSNKSTHQPVRELESAGELGSSSAPKKLQPPSHGLAGGAKACAE